MIITAKSLKFKLVTCLIALVVPLIIILILNNLYSIYLVKKQVLDANTASLKLFTSQLDSELKNVSNYILKVSTSDIPKLDTDDSNVRYFVKAALQTDLQKTIGFYSIVDEFFIYNQVYDEYTYTPSPNLNYVEGQKVREFIRQTPQGALAQSYNEWSIVNVDEKHYLMYSLKLNGVYFGAWIKMENIYEKLAQIDLQSKNFVTILSQDDDFFYNQEAVENNRIDLSELLSSVDIFSGNDNYFISIVDSTKADIKMAAVVQGKNIILKLNVLQKIILVVSILVVVTVLFYMLLFRQIIFKPLINIKKAIEKIENGHLESRLQNNLGSSEFQIIGIAFNSMVKQIKQLKIDVYEEKLTKQEIELEYWHNQIKPHFYLNVINTINSMAQMKEYTLIQQMSQYLSRYVRYMFKRDSGMETIRNELENIKNYLNMQQMRFPDSISCRIDVESKLLDIYIPTLILQTFVENVVKHAFDMYSHTEILIAAFVEHENELHMIVEDNGKGFSDEALSKIMSDIDYSQHGENVGIWNIKKRLYLLYGNKSKLIASNNNGARIEIIIPYEESMI